VNGSFSVIVQEAWSKWQWRIDAEYWELKNQRLMKAIAMKTMKQTLGTARRAATALNSPDFVESRTRGHLDHPECRALPMERRKWQDQKLTKSEERQLMLRLEKLAKIAGLRDIRTSTMISASTQALIDSKANDSEVLKKDGAIVLEGPFTFKELSSDPGDPGEGYSVMWMSDGTGSGDDGDIMIKITAGGTTKTITLVNFSAA